MAETQEKEILEEAKAIFPSWMSILDDAWDELNLRWTPDYVRDNFCAAVLDVNDKAYEIFKHYEIRAFPNLIGKWMDAHGSQIEKMHRDGVNRSLDGKESLGDVLKGVVKKVVHDSFPLIKTFQTSVAQMRKKRAGETFQESIRRLLSYIDISCEKAKVVSRRSLATLI